MKSGYVFSEAEPMFSCHRYVRKTNQRVKQLFSVLFEINADINNECVVPVFLCYFISYDFILFCFLLLVKKTRIAFLAEE